MNDLLKYPFDCLEILRKYKSIRRALIKNDNFIDVKIFVASGTTTDEIIKILEVFLLNAGIKPEFLLGNYGLFYEDLIFENKDLKDFNPDLIYVHTSFKNLKNIPKVSDSISDIDQKLNNEFCNFKDIWKKIGESYGCPVIQNNFELPPQRILGNLDSTLPSGLTNYITNLNYKFSRHANLNDNLYLNDINYLSAFHGIENWFSMKEWYRSKHSVSLKYVPYLSYNIANIISALYGKSKKGLVLDLDNTLWGGVVGEDGYNKVILGDEGIGLIYKNFQKVVKKLINSGVLIVLVSKNNEFDVKEVLKKNKNMILKEKDITAMKVNWQEKSKNIIELSKELSLGMDSFVFWDDNPIERKKVKMKVKDVTVIDPKKNIEEWPRQLASLNIFESGQLTKEDKIKTQLYKIRDDFENNKKNYDDEVQYLRSINISVKVHEINKNNIVRAEQLCNKTNQFNLNLKRLNQKEIIKLTNKKNYDLKMLSLKDDYGDHGLIAIYGIHFQKDKFKIDLFAMSCRVLGRYLENWILNKIKDYAKIKKSRFIHADFVKGPRNNIFKQFLLDNGFLNIKKKNETGVYKMNILNKIKFLEIYEKNR